MAFYRERDLRAFTREVSSDGVGIGGGFIVGGAIGRQIENMIVKDPVTETSPIGTKLVAWAANNGAKFALYWLAKRYDAGTDLTRKATESLAGSVVYDTVLRVANGGVNPADVNLAGYRILGAGGSANVQKLVQENNILRTELNKALQRLAGVSTANNVQVRQMPVTNDIPGEFRYAAVPDPYERQRQYGAMPVTPAVAERQRRYGAMPFEQHPTIVEREKKYGFSGTAEGSAALSSFGMQ